MNQSKFSLADVLTLLAALGYGFVCFLSANFYTLGDTFNSIVLALIIAILLFGTAFGAKLLKRTSRNFKTSLIFEIACLVLFTGLIVFFSYSTFPHYFSVSQQKEVVQRKLTESITEAEKMFSEYERYALNRETRFRNTLKSVVTSKSTSPSRYRKYGFESNGVSDDKQIQKKMFTIHADLFPSNYKEMKKVNSAWLADSRKTVESWKSISIVEVVNDLEQNSDKWLKEMIELSSKASQKGEHAENFKYDLTFDNVKPYFTALGKPSLISVGLAVLVYVLMLFSWIISRRNTKTIVGAKRTTGKYEIN
jgi:hypothetical protein